MNRKSILPASLIAVFCLFLAGCPADGGASAWGRVLGEGGEPIKGAKVVIVSLGMKAESESREGGAFNVSVTHAPMAPDGRLTVSKEGYETYQLEFSSKAELEVERDIVLKAITRAKAAPK